MVSVSILIRQSVVPCPHRYHPARFLYQVEARLAFSSGGPGRLQPQLLQRSVRIGLPHLTRNTLGILPGVASNVLSNSWTVDIFLLSRLLPPKWSLLPTHLDLLEHLCLFRKVWRCVHPAHHRTAFVRFLSILPSFISFFFISDIVKTF